MKQPPSLAALALPRWDQALQSLQELFRRWLPQPAPVLVPIPIRAERQVNPAARRLHGRGG